MNSFNFCQLKSPNSITEAVQVQEALRSQLILKNDFDQIKVIAGIDVGYDTVRNFAHASIVLMTFEQLNVLETIQDFTPVTFPYVPGLLSFREIPAILSAINKLTRAPDLLMVDGQGIAHPRRMGIASHLGVITNLPSIGVAKSCLVGHYKMPDPSKGNTTDLIYRHELIGKVLRSKDNVKPLFISPGHRIDIHTALQFTIQCLTRFRLPEPTRLADKLSKVIPHKNLTQVSFHF